MPTLSIRLTVIDALPFQRNPFTRGVDATNSYDSSQEILELPSYLSAGRALLRLTSELHEIGIEQLLRQVVVDEPRYVAGNSVQFYLHSQVDEDPEFIADAAVDVRVG